LWEEKKWIELESKSRLLSEGLLAINSDYYAHDFNKALVLTLPCFVIKKWIVFLKTLQNHDWQPIINASLLRKANCDNESAVNFQITSLFSKY